MVCQSENVGTTYLVVDFREVVETDDGSWSFSEVIETDVDSWLFSEVIETDVGFGLFSEVLDVVPVSTDLGSFCAEQLDTKTILQNTMTSFMKSIALILML